MFSADQINSNFVLKQLDCRTLTISLQLNLLLNKMSSNQTSMEIDVDKVSQKSEAMKIEVSEAYFY